MKPDRIAVIVLLIVALIATSATRYMAQESHAAALGTSAFTSAESGSNLSNMNSYSLALLLGGLRGPLVMLLWTSSENQKQQKDLEDFDTKVEWIRLLQPEFDTVHLFQIWNKAYNVSVQMSSLSNKYNTILDALDYAQNVMRARPDDINIIAAVGSLYFDKLGNSTEKVYYSDRVREESIPHVRLTVPIAMESQFHSMVDHIGADEGQMRETTDASAGTFSATMVPIVATALQNAFDPPGAAYEAVAPPVAHPNDPGWRRTQLDPILDAAGNVLPNLIQPTQGRSVSDAYDGAELQFLPQFAPYPYGISPKGIAYNYYRRAQELQNLGEKHIQMSEMVLDARAALVARFWGEDEIENSRRAELRLYGLPIPDQRRDMDIPTAKLRFDFNSGATEARAEAIAGYDLADRLLEESLKQYVLHVQKFPENHVYDSHIEHVRGLLAMDQGDLAYLQAEGAAPADREKLLSAARGHYLQAMQEFEYIILRHYIPNSMQAKVFPKGVTPDNVGKMVQAKDFAVLYNRFTQLYPAFYHDQNGDEFSDDRGEYTNYLIRCRRRFEAIGRD